MTAWAVWQLLKRLGINCETLPGFEKPVPAASTHPGNGSDARPPSRSVPSIVRARPAPAPSPVPATRHLSTTLSTPTQTVAPAPIVTSPCSTPAVLPPDLPGSTAEQHRKKKRTKRRNRAHFAKRQALLEAEQALEMAGVGPIFDLDSDSCGDIESVNTSPTWDLGIIGDTTRGSEEGIGELEDDDVFGGELAALGCPSCALVAELSGGRCCLCKDCADPWVG
ncbi:hypothetical protein GGF31_001305 [Allomyces arbusculus]|nr:hypothetical protein GGF31_001305 [Allomyces arbusculus]